jgi:hypothetical protein
MTAQEAQSEKITMTRLRDQGRAAVNGQDRDLEIVPNATMLSSSSSSSSSSSDAQESATAVAAEVRV